ncbi:hypothetical protein SLEP1_g13666 [Rubroshorea leprosula]|uniref:Uncharacterized protein n=1 Tax=Rubroshorea leprosula TaxID=152421 RepID=A0AAV5IMQ4_9ROSI|nr:hypothetical protein SLEP1_g13666 [Rubroshorea leprosula]
MISNAKCLCRTLIPIALRRKHFFKEAIRNELISSSGKCDSVDMPKWDPISSGEGDLILEVTSIFASLRN